MNALIITLAIIGSLTFLIWLLIWLLRPTMTACPYCQLKGGIQHCGRFVCSQCSKEFFATESGKIVPTLWRSTRVALLAWAALFPLAYWDDFREGRWFSPTLMVILLGFHILATAQPKKFPTVSG